MILAHCDQQFLLIRSRNNQKKVIYRSEEGPKEIPYRFRFPDLPVFLELMKKNDCIEWAENQVADFPKSLECKKNYSRHLRHDQRGQE